MNLSDFVVPEYEQMRWIGYAISLVPVVAIVIMVSTLFMNSKTLKNPRTLKRALIAGCTLAVFCVAATVVTSNITNSLKEREDSNFASALQRTYGATSSKSYSQIRETALREEGWYSDLTRDGKTTKVQFTTHDDGTLTLTALTEATYPKPVGR
jgi:hypothetical protein